MREGESSHPPVPNVTQCPTLKVENHVPKNDCLLSINSLKKRFSYLVLQGGFLSSVKKLFKRRKSKSGSGFTKQSKNELNMKAMNDSKPTGMVTMVTLSEATSLHKAIELNGEMLAQDNY